MKIYGLTDDIIVREAIESDKEAYFRMITSHGENMGFTVDEIWLLCKIRKRRGIQCAVTSTDGRTVYGFCGIINSAAEVYIFDEFYGRNYEKQALAIMEISE